MMQRIAGTMLECWNQSPATSAKFGWPKIDNNEISQQSDKLPIKHKQHEDKEESMMQHDILRLEARTTDFFTACAT